MLSSVRDEGEALSGAGRSLDSVLWYCQLTFENSGSCFEPSHIRPRKKKVWSRPCHSAKHSRQRGAHPTHHVLFDPKIDDFVFFRRYPSARSQLAFTLRVRVQAHAASASNFGGSIRVRTRLRKTSPRTQVIFVLDNLYEFFLRSLV